MMKIQHYFLFSVILCTPTSYTMNTSTSQLITLPVNGGSLQNYYSSTQPLIFHHANAPHTNPSQKTHFKQFSTENALEIGAAYESWEREIYAQIISDTINNLYMQADNQWPWLQFAKIQQMKLARFLNKHEQTLLIDSSENPEDALCAIASYIDTSSSERSIGQIKNKYLLAAVQEKNARFNLLILKMLKEKKAQFSGLFAWTNIKGSTVDQFLDWAHISHCLPDAFKRYLHNKLLLDYRHHFDLETTDDLMAHVLELAFINSQAYFLWIDESQEIKALLQSKLFKKLKNSKTPDAAFTVVSIENKAKELGIKKLKKTKKKLKKTKI